jgi:hypothetical protein
VCTVFRSIGATFLIAAAEAGFANQLIARLATTAPNVDPAIVTATGATKLREQFTGAELNSVLHTYAWGIQVAFAISIAACGLGVVFSSFTRWDNINAKKAETASKVKEAAVGGDHSAVLDINVFVACARRNARRCSFELGHLKGVYTRMGNSAGFPLVPEMLAHW